MFDESARRAREISPQPADAQSISTKASTSRCALVNTHALEILAVSAWWRRAPTPTFWAEERWCSLTTLMTPQSNVYSCKIQTYRFAPIGYLDFRFLYVVIKLYIVQPYRGSLRFVRQRGQLNTTLLDLLLAARLFLIYIHLTVLQK